MIRSFRPIELDLMIEQNRTILRLCAADSPLQQAEAVVLASLAEARRALARQWFALSPGELERAYTRRLGNAQRLVRSSDVFAAERNQVDEELIAHALAKFQAPEIEGRGLAALLVAMLYLQPHELPCMIPLEAVPDWLREDYWKYMVASPEIFCRSGEADAFHRHLQRWLGYLHAGILNNRQDPLWLYVENQVFHSLNLVPLYFNSANLRDIYRLRAELFEFTVTKAGNTLDYNFPPRANRQRLRVGVFLQSLSGLTESIATLPVFEHLDRRAFEIVLFTMQVTNTPFERYCVSRADQFVPLSGKGTQQVQTLRNADLDFLLIGANLTAVTTDRVGLALHRLARIQIALVASCTTTGMRHMDYYLSGRLSEPATQAQAQYTERLLLGAGPAHCFHVPEGGLPAPVETLNRELLGIPADAVVFASGANFFKIIPEVQDVWIRILERSPGSRLLLFPFNPHWSDRYRGEDFLERFRQALAARNVSEERLLVFGPAANRGEVLERLRLADLYLDSFPFSGATSLLDPLQMGLPPIGLDGSTFRALVGPGLLRSIGLEELIASSPEDYVELACHLASDPAARSRLRAVLQQAMASRPKFLDSQWYGAEVGRILTAVWKERCAANFAPL